MQDFLLVISSILMDKILEPNYLDLMDFSYINIININTNTNIFDLPDIFLNLFILIYNLFHNFIWLCNDTWMCSIYICKLDKLVMLGWTHVTDLSREPTYWISCDFLNLLIRKKHNWLQKKMNMTTSKKNYSLKIIFIIKTF